MQRKEWKSEDDFMGKKVMKKKKKRKRKMVKQKNTKNEIQFKQTNEQFYQS